MKVFQYFRLDIIFIIAALLGITSCSILMPGPDPWNMDTAISSETKTLIEKAFTFEDMTIKVAVPNGLTISDYHVHLIARGTTHESKNAYINPNRYTWWHPYLKLKTLLLMGAAQVSDYDQLDTQYQERLLNLIQHFKHAQEQYTPAATPAITLRFYLYAMDYYYDEAGNPVKKYTDIYIPNDYVIRTAQLLNSKLSKTAGNGKNSRVEIIPVMSVHPYRKDFIPEISRLAKPGVRFMKWVPSSMNIDLGKVSTQSYSALAEKKIVLLVHTGKEHVLQTRAKLQVFGDPVKLSTALDCGVNVVALHSGREGKVPNINITYFERFMEMMAKEKYQGQLFGEISAMTLGRILFVAGSHEKLNTIIHAAQPGGILHQRMLNGSDYPVPAVSLFNPTRELANRKMITQKEGGQLDEIFPYNPLLFDFVMKRTIRSIGDSDKSQYKLPDSVFLENDFYQGSAPGNTHTCPEE